jgi:hypothetical protein
MNLGETGWSGVDCIHLSQCGDQWRPLVNTIMNLPSSIKCWKILKQLSDWRLLKYLALLILFRLISGFRILI